MYYQSLARIETSLSKSHRMEDKMLSKYVSDLDKWLITRKNTYKNRLNPLQFSIDYELTNDVAEYLFDLCLKEKVFDVYYEVETDLKESLGIITSEQFKILMTKGSIIVAHPYRDEDYTIYAQNVNILFALVERPIKELTLEDGQLKKEIAPTYTGAIATDPMRRALLNRGG